MTPDRSEFLSDIPHRRHNLLTGETVLVSPHRLKRPWQGKVEEVAPDVRPEYDAKCYLCPGNKRAGDAQNPPYSETFVFTNDFAALLPESGTHSSNDSDLLRAETEAGICRVVCFSPRHDLTLARMNAPTIRGVVDTWVKEFEELAARPGIAAVQIFENKGALMGCSNPHPHGQIWATSSVPFEVAREDDHQRAWKSQRGSLLLADYLALELQRKERIVCSNDSWVALVPWWAKWPFETMLLPRRPVANLSGLTPEERDGLADILRRLTARYDNLFATSFPYTMGFHQAPVKQPDSSHWCLHAHFYPPLLRSATVQKFMVGFEMLAMPQRDLTPEQAAGMLRDQSETHYLDAPASGASQ